VVDLRGGNTQCAYVISHLDPARVIAAALNATGNQDYPIVVINSVTYVVVARCEYVMTLG